MTGAGAFMTSGIATSIPPQVATPIVFDTVIADNNSFWDPAHPTRLNILQPGLYFLHGNIEFTANGKGARIVGFRKNGRTTGYDPDSVDLGHSETYYVPAAYPNTTPQVHAHAAAVLAAGDYVEMYGFTDFSPGDEATLAVRYVRPNTPQFAIFYQGPALP